MKLKLFKKDNETQQKKDTAVQPDEEDPLTKYLDGMGRGVSSIREKVRNKDQYIGSFFSLTSCK